MNQETNVTELKEEISKHQRIARIFELSGNPVNAVLEGHDAVDVLQEDVEERIYKALEDFGFSPTLDKTRVVDAYLTHLKEKGDPLGLMLCEVDHMVEAMLTAKIIMYVGPKEFSEHRDAIGLAALFHDIYAVTRKSGIEIGNKLSLADYLARNIGHEQEKKWNKPIIEEVALAAIDQRDELYDLVIAAVDFSSGKHKMSETEWDNTQWVNPLRIVDNMATQREYGNRHMYLIYNWAVDVFQGVEKEEAVAKRIKKRQGFCKMLAEGKIKELIQNQVMERKSIDLQNEYPGLVDKIEEVGGFLPVSFSPITAYTTAMQIAYNRELNKLFPAFAEAGYDRAAYTTPIID